MMIMMTMMMMKHVLLNGEWFLGCPNKCDTCSMDSDKLTCSKCDAKYTSAQGKICDCELNLVVYWQLISNGCVYIIFSKWVMPTHLGFPGDPLK